MPTDQHHEAIFRSFFQDMTFVDPLIRERRSGDEDIAALLTDEPFAPCDDILVDDETPTTHGEAVFRTRLKDGQTLYVLVLRKSTPDPETPLQMFEYRVRIWHGHERLEGLSATQPLPPIKAIVLYQGSAPWTVPRSTMGLLDTARDSLSQGSDKSD